jgi:hypothetical protein
MKKLFLSILFAMVFSIITNHTFSINEDCMKYCVKKEEVCRNHCDLLAKREARARCHQYCKERSKRCYVNC